MSSLKRPLAVAGLSMFITVLCAVSFSNTALVIIMMAVASVTAIVFMIFRVRHSHTCVVFAVSAVIACLLVLTAQYRHDFTVSLCGENSTVEAVITSEAEFSHDRGRYYAVARLKTLNGESCYGKIRFSFSETKDEIDPSELEIGDTVTFSSYVYKIGSGSERAHDSFKAKGIYLGAYALRNVTMKKPLLRPLSFYTAILNDKINDKLNFYFDDDVSGMLIAMLTGNKDYCTDEVYSDFKMSGAAHLMAVSGLHLSIWISILSFFLNRKKKLSKVSYVIMISAVVLVVFLASFSPSVCRAAFMSFLLLTGRVIGRKSDPLNSLGFAMICILCANVYAIHSISFQLSFACVFSIITVAMPVSEKIKQSINSLKLYETIKKALGYLCDSVTVSLTIIFFTFPIGAWHFGYTSALSPVTNLLIIPVCTPLLFLTVLFILLSGIPLVSDLLFFGVNTISRYMLAVVGKLADSPVAILNTGEYEVIFWAAVAIGVALVFLLYRLAQRYRARVTALLLSVFVLFFFFRWIEIGSDEYKIRLIGNGESMSAVLVYNRTAVLIGAAERYYFTEEAEFVFDSESARPVAVLPSENISERSLEYLCADIDVDNILYEDEELVLFGKITVENKGGYAIISGNGKTTAIFYSEYLQPTLSCDIIIDNGTVICNGSNTVYNDENLLYGTVRVNSRGEVTVRGEKFWQSLTKRSLKPT